MKCPACHGPMSVGPLGLGCRNGCWNGIPRPTYGRVEWTQCSPTGCAGWFLSGETHQVERCDECDRFRDDHEAAQHVAAFGWQDDARVAARMSMPINRPARTIDRYGKPRKPEYPITGAQTCDECGSTRVQHLDWIDSNRDDRVIGDSCPDDNGSMWCERCGEDGDGNNYQSWLDLKDIRPNARKLRQAQRLREVVEQQESDERQAARKAAAKPGHKLPHQR